MKKQIKRNSNHELLRLVSMFLIVLGHILIHGHVFDNSNNMTFTHMIYILEFILIIHVNSYVLVTGYYQSKTTFKQSNLWKLIFQVWFYKILIVIILSVFGIISLSKLNLLKEILPIDLTQYWFINTYLLLYCISPFLNKLIKSMNKKEFKRLIIVGFVISSIIPTISKGFILANNGYTLYNFIYLYFVGAYLSEHPLDKSHVFKRLSTATYKLVLIILFIFCVLTQYLLWNTANEITGINTVFTDIANYIQSAKFNYSNPIILIQSILYFAFFTSLTIKSRLINKLSSLVLGVYLIHDNSYIRGVIYHWLNIDKPIYSPKFIFYIFLVTIIIFVTCLIIEFIRQLIFKFIHNRKLSKKVRENYYSWFNSLYIKE